MVYPDTCSFCGKILPTTTLPQKQITKDFICNQCRESLPYIQGPRCFRCGKPLRYHEREFCYDCGQRHFSYDQGKAVWLHKGAVSKSIYDFKYHNKRIYAKTYGEELIRLYQHTIEMWRVDCIIPVPLHPRRQRRRGYNQAEVLAHYLGEALKLPVETKIVKRKRYTNPQKLLGHRERHNNLKNAFFVDSKYLQGMKNILVIDDIYTTGATIDGIAKTLKKAGIKKVYFLTISIGQGF